MTANLHQEQINLESGAVKAGIERYRKLLREHKPLPPDFALLKRCIPPLQGAIEEYRESRRRGQYRHIKKELLKLSSIEIAYLTISTVIFSQHLLNAPVQTIAQLVGKAIMDQINFKMYEKTHPEYLHAVIEGCKSQHARHRRNVILATKKKMGVPSLNWGQRMRFDVGYKLITLLIESTGIIYLEDGFTDNRNQAKMVRWDETTRDWLDEAHKRCEALKPQHLPMIVPPVPWEGMTGGGYITLQQNIIREGLTQDHSMRKCPGPIVLKALNAVQNTAWRINTNILPVIEELMSRQSNRLGVLASTESIEFPLQPFPCDKQAADAWIKENKEEFIAWKQAMTRAYDKKAGELGKERAQHQILGIARQFSKYKEIYFPWNLDFRGRMYPIPSMLHPQGEDLAKGLLEFAKPVRLGQSGVKWLAIHGANTFGEDKISLQKRIQWVKDHEALILDSAEQPLGGELFWTDADKPFQFLAFCFEWKNYVDQGENYKSHLPVNVDGSCNGLQHYSALLKDEIGGKAVNLIQTGETRNDIYNIVAEKTAALVHQDALNGNDIAILWDGLITRKTVKRAVMTTPYGVTNRGISEQIWDDTLKGSTLEELINLKYKATSYLGEKIRESIGNTVLSSQIGMTWFKDCVRVFNQANKPIQWVTPSGMPVLQHKLKTQTKRIKTMTGEALVYLSLKSATPKLNPMKQLYGIAPNVIHSLDAAHMSLTIVEALKQGIKSFAMIHDSFGCPAGQMEKLYHILREEFVKMYSQDILQNLKEQWRAQLPENLKDALPELPEYGTLRIQEVLKSEYFFA